MSPHKFFQDMRAGLEDNRLGDPGHGGTIQPVPECAFQSVALKASGAEDRELALPAGLAVGSQLLVFADTASSGISIQQNGGATGWDTAGNGTLDLSADGQFAVLQVINANGTKVWRKATGDGALS